MSSSAPQSKAALASAVASSHVESLVKTLFGPCTGSERSADGFSPLKDSHRSKNRKGYYRRHKGTSSSNSKVTPCTATGYEEKSRMAPISEQHHPFVEQQRRAQFNSNEESKRGNFRDDVFLTLQKCDLDDDAISAITTLTLDELEKRRERDDAISGITSNTLEKMAHRYVINSKFKPSGIISSPCSNPQWHDWNENAPNPPPRNRKDVKKTTPKYQNRHIPVETRQEEKIREQAAESYETVIARLNYLRRSLEESKSRKQHRSKSGVSIVTAEDLNQQIDNLEFGEI